MENKTPMIAKKKFLYNKGTFGSITIPKFKLYCTDKVIKIAWHWHKKDMWVKGIESKTLT